MTNRVSGNGVTISAVKSMDGLTVNPLSHRLYRNIHEVTPTHAGNPSHNNFKIIIIILKCRPRVRGSTKPSVESTEGFFVSSPRAWEHRSFQGLPEFR